MCAIDQIYRQLHVRFCRRIYFFHMNKSCDKLLAKDLFFFLDIIYIELRFPLVPIQVERKQKSVLFEVINAK